MQPRVWGSWPGDLVRQYGRFRLYKTIISLAPGVLTKNRRLVILVENGENEPVRIQSLEARQGDVAEVITHVKQWLLGERRYIDHIRSIMAKRDERDTQLEFERKMVQERNERYQIVEEALKELEASVNELS